MKHDVFMLLAPDVTFTHWAVLPCEVTMAEAQTDEIFYLKFSPWKSLLLLVNVSCLILLYCCRYKMTGRFWRHLFQDFRKR